MTRRCREHFNGSLKLKTEYNQGKTNGNKCWLFYDDRFVIIATISMFCNQ